MKLHKKIPLIGLFFLFTVGGCEQMADSEPDVQESKTTPNISSYKKSTNEDISTFKLYAGQNNDVGEIQAWNDDNNLYVKYIVNDECCLKETHLHVASSFESIPQTKKGNPIPGKFDHKDVHECKTEFTYTIEIGREYEDELYIAAHAVVTCSENGYLYGIERNSGKIYEIDVLTGKSSEKFDIEEPPSNTNVGPNGLAYDTHNSWFYYCDYPSEGNNTTLYFSDGNVQYISGNLGTVEIAAADFYDGKYYYISGPPASDNLYEVTFDNDGYISFNEQIANIADDEHGWNFYGDIAIKEGIVYGWGMCGTDNKYEYFTYNIEENTFDIATPDYQTSLQLAFGSNGILYGHRSGNDGEFYRIGQTNGEATLIEPTPDPVHAYTDCASGNIREPIEETAWADGERFTQKGNWATYFNYTMK